MPWSGREPSRHGGGSVRLLPAIGGAIGQEIIDLLAVLNAVRVALPTEELQDY